MKNLSYTYKRVLGSHENKAIYLFLGFLHLALGFTSCKKFLEIPSPTAQLVTASVFSNAATATSAVTVIYNQMSGESEVIAFQNGLLSDELKGYATSGNNQEYYINAMIGNNSLLGEWQNAYKYIFQANAVIEGLQNNVGVSPAVKQQLTGEAYFIRAFWHFYLTNCYGAVPLITTTDYTITSVVSRTPRLQVLQQVVNDLTTAQGLLSTNYIDVSDTTTTADRIRPNVAGATALLARAYLYLGDYSSQNMTDYQSAVNQASAVISNNAYSLATLDNVFLANSSEAIWQLGIPLPASFNTVDGYNFILLAAPNSGKVTISPQLLNSFEPDDQRRTSWVDSITATGKTYYFPYKYKVQSGGDPITEYTMVLRLAEQYLIRAEAQAHGAGNGISGAIADLNVIRNRAGLPNYAGGQDRASVLAAILHERQVELFTEWGARWFDLNRTGNTNAVMNVVTPLKGGIWSSDGHQLLYPIPSNDILKDKNITQNPGY